MQHDSVGSNVSGLDSVDSKKSRTRYHYHQVFDDKKFNKCPTYNIWYRYNADTRATNKKKFEGPMDYNECPTLVVTHKD
jgi:hypothetical protein